jgi:hypothetical protein
MAVTKKILLLSPAQLQTVQNWYMFIGHGTDIDERILNKLKGHRRGVAISEKCAHILLKWWNYLPGSMIDQCDKELYHALHGFLE